MEEKALQVNEKAGIQFSLSFLIQILGTVVLAVWGYSQLDARISNAIAERNFAISKFELLAVIGELTLENLKKT